MSKKSSCQEPAILKLKEIYGSRRYTIKGSYKDRGYQPSKLYTLISNFTYNQTRTGWDEDLNVFRLIQKYEIHNESLL